MDSVRGLGWVTIEKMNNERADAETTMGGLVSPWAWASLAFPLLAWDPVLVVAAAVVGRPISGY